MLHLLQHLSAIQKIAALHPSLTMGRLLANTFHHSIILTTKIITTLAYNIDNQIILSKTMVFSVKGCMVLNELCEGVKNDCRNLKCLIHDPYIQPQHNPLVK